MSKLFVIGALGYMLAGTLSAATPYEVSIVDESAVIVPFTYSPVDDLPTFVLTMAPLPVAYIADQVGSFLPVANASLPKVPMVPKQHVRYLPRGGLLCR